MRPNGQVQGRLESRECFRAVFPHIFIQLRLLHSLKKGRPPWPEGCSTVVCTCTVATHAHSHTPNIHVITPATITANQQHTPTKHTANTTILPWEQPSQNTVSSSVLTWKQPQQNNKHNRPQDRGVRSEHAAAEETRSDK